MEETEENLPDSLPLLWMDLKQQGWKEEGMVREVMEVLGEEGRQKTGIWISEMWRSEEVTGLPQSWRALEYSRVHGIEAEVTCPCGAVSLCIYQVVVISTGDSGVSVGPYTAERWSRARLQTVCVTQDQDRLVEKLLVH